MKTYCVTCRIDTENIDLKMVRTKNNSLNMQAQCPHCRIKKSRFVKEQEAKGLLSNLGIKTPLNKIPLLMFCFKCSNKMLCLVTIAMICSNLPSIWKLQSFQRLLYNSVKHL